MKKNNKKGFTLVELVIVVAVMAILVAVAIPVVGNITSKAQTNVNSSNARTIESMIKLEIADAGLDTAGAEATVDAALIKNALWDAKLGIDKGTFYWDADMGKVATGTSSADGDIAIAYTAGVLSVGGTDVTSDPDTSK